MKKVLAYIVAALFCMNISAQKLSESFEGSTFPPEGWSSIDASSYSAWRRVSKVDNESLNVFDGQACAVVPGSYGTENYLITPQLRPAAGEKLHFAARVKEFASKGVLKIDVSTSGTNASSFVTLASYSTSSNATGHLPKSDWKEYEIDLSAYVNQRIYVAFHQVGEAENIYVDAVSGVTLAGSATCDAPTNLEVTDASAESVTISWEGEAETYEYYLAESGQVPDWSEAGTIKAKQIVLTDLYEEQAYDFYVRAYCSEQEQSLAPSVSFSTSCVPATIPWLETFSRDATGDVEPECWVVSSPGTHQVWVVADKEYDDEGNAQVVYGQAHLYASGGGDRPQLFAMPAFDAQLNTLEIAFDYKTSQVGENYGKLEIGYMTNAADANTFVSLKTFDQTLTYVRETYSLAELPAKAKFIAFRYAGGTSYLSGVSMDNFVMAEIGHSQEIDPADEVLPDASIWELTYCEAQFTWYAYSVEAFAIALFDFDSQERIAGVLVTTSECERFAQYDGIEFSEYDDYENHYYSSTKWVLNTDGVSKGEAWDKCVRNIRTAGSSMLGLKAGKYRVSVYKYTSGASQLGELIQSIDFELTEKVVDQLKAEVSDDKKKATLSWQAPELGANERLYVRVWSGETVAYDNFDDSRVKPVSPLTVDVAEGKTYTAIVQVIDKHGNALGAEVETTFTVGVNNYEPKNLNAEVTKGNHVTFSWQAEELADAYELVMYWEGEFYGTLSVSGLSQTTIMPKDGKWSWTVQAFTLGANGKYFEASQAIVGNDFETEGANIPTGAIELKAWYMDAAYAPYDTEHGFAPNDPDIKEGKHFWVVRLLTDEDQYDYPQFWISIYTDKEFALSGKYSVALGNVHMGNTGVYEYGNSSPIGASDVEMELVFEGYSEEMLALGMYYAIYSGYCNITIDGQLYHISIMNLTNISYDFLYLIDDSESPIYLNMVDEGEFDGVEQVLTEHGFDLNQPMYNIMGQQVDASYKGIVIQNGKKFMLQ